jgi:antirestriction protein ArdC
VKLYSSAERAASDILDAFKAGNLPTALAPLFIRRKDDLPSNRWSWGNRLIAALHGCSDARAFGSWLEVDRAVRKGEKARAVILAPCTRKIEGPDGDERLAVYGFRGVCVFDVSQTDGAPLPLGVDDDTAEFLRSLPLRSVAESWGLSITALDGRTGGALGWYRHKQAIALGVKNLSTWAHELVHAADDRLGGLVERGQHWRSETVAELGGAVVLCCIGLPLDADTGGAWDYISRYARDAKLEPITACMTILKRTCDAVALILDTAEQLAQANALTLDGATEEQYAAASTAIQVAD